MTTRSADHGPMRYAGILAALALAFAGVARAIPEGPAGSTTGDAGTALGGLAPAADAQLFTGTAGTRVDIKVPAGRNATQPNIALVYSSAGSQTGLGGGWDLPLGRIERSTRVGTPRYDGTDTYVANLVDGAQELVKRTDGTYAERIDERRAVYTFDATANTWTLHDRSGRDFTFGDRVGPNVAGGANGTFAWLLTRARDPNGNTVDFTYQILDGHAYPSTIRWGGNHTAAGTMNYQHVYQVKFDLRARSADGIPETVTYMGGYADRRRYTLQYVRVAYDHNGTFSNPPACTSAPTSATPACTIRTYQLSWRPSASNDRALLDWVKLFGSDGTVYPTYTQFTYTEASSFALANRSDSIAFDGTEYDMGPVRSNAPCEKSDFIDMNGDGYADYVDARKYNTTKVTCTDPTGATTHQCWKIWLNQGPGGTKMFGTTPLVWYAPQGCIIQHKACDSSQCLDTPNDFQSNGFPDPYGKVLRTVVATMDVNGDRRADLVWLTNPVDVTAGDVRVAYNTGSGFSAPTTWVSGIGLREGYDVFGDQRSGPDLSDPRNNSTFADFIDLNGDGLPDHVNSFNYGTTNITCTAPDGSTSHNCWGVRRNTGSGLAPGVPVWAPRRFVRQGGPDTTDRNILYDLFDANGDGLPDIVDVVDLGGNKFWKVWHGRGLVLDSALAAWEQFDGTPAFMRSPLGVGSLRNWDSDGFLYRYDVLDMNGDGLADIVDARSWRSCAGGAKAGAFCTTNADCPGSSCVLTNQWNVCLNNGGSQTANPPDPTVASFSCAPWTRNTPLRRSSASDPDQPLLIDTFDVNGDGIADAVDVTAQNAVNIWYSQPTAALDVLQSVSTLVTADASLVANTTFTYTQYDQPQGPINATGISFPLWVLATNTLYPAQGGSIGTSYQFTGGLFDQQRREFRGFATAQSTDDYGVIATTTFDQTPALRGKITQEKAWRNDGSGRLSQTDYTWANGQISGRADALGAAVPSYQPRLDQVVRTSFAPNEASSRAVTTTYGHDPCGNISDEKEAEGATTLAHSTSHFNALNGSCAADGVCTGICDRADTISTECGVSKELHYFNDASANLQYTKLVPPANVGTCASLVNSSDRPQTNLAYDAYGNLQQTTDARGGVTAVSFPVSAVDGSTTYYLDHLYPSQSTADPSGANLTTKTIVDMRFGTAIVGIDPNGAKLTRTYDAFGRIATVVEAGQTAAQPTKQYTYTVGPVSQVDTATYEPNTPGYLHSSAFTDALNRPLQTQSQRRVGASLTTVVTGAVARDAHGRVTTQYVPFVTTNAANVKAAVPAGLAAVVPTYDNFGRTIRQQQIDGTAITTSYGAWVETTCDAKYNADAPAHRAGSCTAIEKDGLGHVRFKRTYFGAHTTPDMVQETRYDLGGHILRTIQSGAGSAATPTTVNTYDIFGANRSVADPDSGTWQYDYDSNGNLVYQNDPGMGPANKGQHVENHYDALNRITHRYLYTGSETYSGRQNPLAAPACGTDCNGTCFVLAQFTYDTAPSGKGRLARVVEYDPRLPAGVAAVDTTFDGYDARGHILSTTRTIRICPKLTGTCTTGELLTKSFTTTNTYDAIGRLQTTTAPYPNAQGKETITHDYSSDGSPMALHSDLPASYVSDVQFDAMGHVTYRALGNGVYDRFSYWNETQKYRLRDVLTGKTAEGVLADCDANPQGRTEYRCVRYGPWDEDGNVRAVSDNLAFFGARRSLTQYAKYDDIARLKRSVQCGGGPRVPGSRTASFTPAPYDMTFDHDQLGNLTGKDNLTYTLSTTHPHQVSMRGPDAIGYDANGSMISLPSNRTLTYDPLGHLIAVSKNAAAVGQYYYDHTGQRVAAVTASGAVSFFFGTFEVRSDYGTVARHFSLNGQLIATSYVNAPAGGGLAFDTKAGAATLLATRTGLGTTLVLVLGMGFVLPGSGRRLRLFGRVRPVWMTGLVAVFLVAPLMPARNAWAAGDPEVGKTYFYHTDHVANPVFITDAAGNAVERLVYRPYGEENALTTSDTVESGGEAHRLLGFTGQYRDDGTGLVYFGARYYDPALGMFVTHDPADALLSPYSYVGNNPLKMTDPSGALPFLIVLLIVFLIAAVAAGVQAGLNGASPGEAIQAAVIAGAIAAATYAVGSIVGGYIANGVTQGTISTTVQAGFQVAQFGALAYSLYGAARAFNDGQYAAGGGAIAGMIASIALGGSGKTPEGNQRTAGLESKFTGTLNDASNPNAQLEGIEGPWVGTRDFTDDIMDGLIAGFATKLLYAGAGLVSAAVSKITAPAATTGAATAEDGAVPAVGSKVYRAFGADSRGVGRFWTDVNPAETPGYADAAGLPSQPGVTGYAGGAYNSGGFVAEGTVLDNAGVGVPVGGATPLHGNTGGLTEFEFPSPGTQIRIDRVYGVNPPLNPR